MKFLIVVISVLVSALAQRPWYAGSRPIGYPDLADRFKTESNDIPQEAPNPNDYYNLPPKGIPIDAHGDIDLVNRLNTWPRENRPFWLLNADQIEAHRNTPIRHPLPDYGYYVVYYPYVYNYQPQQVDRNDVVDDIVLLNDLNDNNNQYAL